MKDHRLLIYATQSPSRKQIFVNTQQLRELRISIQKPLLKLRGNSSAGERQEYWQALGELSALFSKGGARVLLDKEELTYEEWLELYELGLLWTKTMPHNSLVRAEFLHITQRGIASLVSSLKKKPGVPVLDEDANDMHWYERLVALIEHRYTTNSRDSSDEESVELIASMIPIAQITRSELILRKIAETRYSLSGYPHRVDYQDRERLCVWFVKEHKNW